MRIDFVGVGHPMNVAKSLKRALAARGREIGLRKCEELFAKMTGYAHWHELRIPAARATVPFMKDIEAGEAEAAARGEQFVSRLSEHAGVSREVAGDVVDQLQPTGMRAKTLAAGSPPALAPL